MAAKRRCSDCPNLCTNTRCTACQQRHDQRRNKRRGDRYGGQHQASRTRWVPIVATGTVNCARCNELIAADQQFDLDHLDDGTSWPSHQRCNRAAFTR